MDAPWIPNATPMPLGPSVIPPVGYTNMIKDYPHEQLASEKELILDSESLFSLIAVHDTLRRGWVFTPEAPKADAWNPLAWNFELECGAGDCEDWALSARRLAQARGVPREACRIALCKMPFVQPPYNDHAVLSVWTNLGVFVLDVAIQGISPWSSLLYEWIAVEYPPSPHGWARIGSKSLSDLAKIVNEVA